MKRSEMIKIMTEEADSEFVMTLEQIAERMLDAAVDAGMLPPMVFAEPCQGQYDHNWEEE